MSSHVAFRRRQMCSHISSRDRRRQRRRFLSSLALQLGAGVECGLDFVAVTEYVFYGGYRFFHRLHSHMHPLVGSTVLRRRRYSWMTFVLHRANRADFLAPKASRASKAALRNPPALAAKLNARCSNTSYRNDRFAFQCCNRCCLVQQVRARSDQYRLLKLRNVWLPTIESDALPAKVSFVGESTELSDLGR